MDFKALLNTSEYDFLRTNPRLGSRIMLLGVSGSYGYGSTSMRIRIPIRSSIHLTNL